MAIPSNMVCGHNRNSCPEGPPKTTQPIEQKLNMPPLVVESQSQNLPQEKLQGAFVVIVGLGAVGSSAAILLARAGVGHPVASGFCRLVLWWGVGGITLQNQPSTINQESKQTHPRKHPGFRVFSLVPLGATDPKGGFLPVESTGPQQGHLRLVDGSPVRRMDGHALAKATDVGRHKVEVCKEGLKPEGKLTIRELGLKTG